MHIPCLVLLGMLWAMPTWAFLSHMNAHEMPDSPPSLVTTGSRATEPVVCFTIMQRTDASNNNGNCATSNPMVTMTASSASAGGSLKTDFGVYAEPPLQPLPQAGAKLIDPVFGTTVLRLTDGSQGESRCSVTYATIPVFNINNTRAYVVCKPYSLARFYQFNPTTFVASSPTKIPSSPANLKQFWMIWSGTNPDIIYGNNGAAIYAYNVATQSMTTILNAEQILAAGERLNWQMSKSQNDDVFADTFDGSSGNIGYIVWRRSDNKVLLKQYEPSDEVEIDKTGRYLIVSFTTSCCGASASGSVRIWDLQTGLSTKLSPSQGFYHRGLGQGRAFTWTYGGSGTLGYRTLTTPTLITKLLPDSSWSYHTGQQDHFSMLADNESWALASRYSTTGSGVVNAFDNEILQVSTDGSHRVRRLVHHRSVAENNNYDAQPKANISRDGRFIAFTSNWGHADGRLDVYVVQIPLVSSSSADTTSPAGPINLRVQ